MDTYDETVARIRSQAATAFDKHVITEHRPWVWKCAQPGSWVYGFYVMVAPGAVVFYGDCGEAIFRMSNGPEASVFEWLKSTLREPQYYDYFLSKLENKSAFRKFYPGDALAWAKRVDDEDLIDTLHAYEGDGGLQAHQFWAAANERHACDFPSCEKWSAGAHWVHQALAAFVKLGPTAPPT